MRLIDADSLSRRVKTECNPYGKPTIEYESGCKVMEQIDSAPTVDAEPVRHGHWIAEAIMPTIAFDTVRVIARCSECGCYDAICHADAMGYYKGNPVIWGGFITNYQGNERLVEEFALTFAGNREKRKYCPACGAKMDGKEQSDG